MENNRSQFSTRIHALQGSSLEMQALLQELETHQIELELQNEELKESRLALEKTNQRYVNLYEFAPVAYMTFTEHGQIRECNLTAATLLGVDKRFLMGYFIHSWIQSSELSLFLKHLDQCKKKITRIHSFFHLKNNDGQLIPTEFMTTCSPDPFTGEILFRTAITDLSEKKKAEAELDQFFILSNDLLCIGGMNGYFKRLNATWEQMLGYTSEELMARPYLDLVHPDDHEAMVSEVKKLKNGANTINLRNRMIKKDQSLVWLEWNAVLSGDVFYGVARNVTTQIVNEKEMQNRHSEVATGMAKDITHLKHVEESLKEAIAHLEQEKTVREHFVFALTHDLRTPLTTAKLCTQMIERDGHRPEIRSKATSRIIRNIDRLDQMILDLLDANRIKAGQQVALSLDECNLKHIAQLVINEFSSVHGDRFSLHCPKNIFGVWDQSGLRRVLENLVNNAVKYGDPKKKVSLKLKDHRDEILLTVHNWGEPILPENLSTIFEQFRRTRSAEEGTQKGWGLGLTLVRGIVEAHGGRIEVQSMPEKGTTFFVKIPRLKPIQH